MVEFGVVQGHAYTAVEFVAGLDAKRLLVEAKLSTRGIAPGCALALISHAARAIGYAHGRGVLHLGLAPTNLVVTAEGDVQVTDFGILAATMTGRPIDAPRLADRIAYFAPEQLQGEELSPASDVFVLGSIIHELISGQRAFPGSHARAVSQAIHAGPPAELSLPRPIEAVLRRCFARSPHERFTDARAFADALDTALRTAPVAGTQRELAALVKAALGKTDATTKKASEFSNHLGWQQPLPIPSVPLASPKSRSRYVPKSITIPPPIPVARAAADGASHSAGAGVMADQSTLVGVPGAPRPRTPSRANGDGGDRRFAIAIRPPTATARGSSPIATLNEPNGTPVLQQHPITDPPFQQEQPTSQIPPELVQDLLNASMPDASEARRSQPRLGSEAANSGLFGLPDEEAGSAPLDPDPSPLAAVTGYSAKDLTAVDLQYLTPVPPKAPPLSKRRWWLLGATGLLAVAGIGLAFWPSRSANVSSSKTPAGPQKSGALKQPPATTGTPTKPGASGSAPKPATAGSAAKLSPTAPAAPATGVSASQPQPAPPSDSPAQPAELLISSSPAGARVFIDGADQGVTPVKLAGSTDHHNIALLLPGHELYLGEAAGHGTLDIPLKPVTPSGGPAGIKVIRCKDKGRYYVFVDGKPTGMTCPTERIECALGPHTVEVYDMVTESRRKWDIVVKETRLSHRVRID